MQTKKLNLAKMQGKLSRAEMKEIIGGNPTWSATCTNAISGQLICYDSIGACNIWCSGTYGGTCSINYGSVGCGTV